MRRHGDLYARELASFGAHGVLCDVGRDHVGQLTTNHHVRSLDRAEPARRVLGGSQSGKQEEKFHRPPNGMGVRVFSRPDDGSSAKTKCFSSLAVPNLRLFAVCP